MSHRSSIRSALRELRKFYAYADAFMVAAKESVGSPCDKGCADCCRMLSMASICEGLLAIDAVYVSSGALGAQRLMDKASKQFKELIDNPSLTVSTWFNQQKECVFLTNEECALYHARPIVCRTHMAVGSDRSVCQLHNKELVGYLDVRKVRSESFKVTQHIAFDLRIPMLVGPWPVTLCWAARVYAEGSESLKRSIKGTPWETAAGSLEFWATRLKMEEPNDQEESRGLCGGVGGREEGPVEAVQDQGGSGSTP